MACQLLLQLIKWINNGKSDKRKVSKLFGKMNISLNWRVFRTGNGNVGSSEEIEKQI